MYRQKVTSWNYYLNALTWISTVLKSSKGIACFVQLFQRIRGTAAYKHTSLLCLCQAPLPYLALHHFGLPLCFHSEMMKLVGLENSLTEQRDGCEFHVQPTDKSFCLSFHQRCCCTSELCVFAGSLTICTPNALMSAVNG